MEVDIKTLERLAELLKLDAARARGLSATAMLSIASIIEAAIGAPLMWPSRKEGCEAAVLYYPGAPDLRHGFNAGVKWAVEHYQPTIDVALR